GADAGNLCVVKRAVAVAEQRVNARITTTSHRTQIDPSIAVEIDGRQGTEPPAVGVFNERGKTRHPAVLQRFDGRTAGGRTAAGRGPPRKSRSQGLEEGMY